VGPGWDQLGARTPAAQRADIEHYPLSKRPIEYFRMFYVDTALFGAPHALRCSLEFFGVERVLFASDSPFDPEQGPGYIRATIEDIESLGLSDADREAIYEGNARRVLGVSAGSSSRSTATSGAAPSGSSWRTAASRARGRRCTWSTSSRPSAGTSSRSASSTAAAARAWRSSGAVTATAAGCTTRSPPA